MDLVESLRQLANLLPIDIVLKDCLRYGVESVVLKDQLGIAASYGDNVIVLDPDADRELVARAVRRRHGIELRSDEEIFLWLWFHELCHHIQSRSNPGMDLNSPRAQAEAERFAYENFLSWRIKR